ncbi:MAG TPA: GerMN domain-containing protein [Dissulfurispiraceae bacterium]|nr:GerMN domain-containing protein [Dissulfurispiraceae bacterium]
MRRQNKVSWKKKAVLTTFILMLAGLAGWLTSKHFLFPEERPLVEDSSKQGKVELPPMQSSEIKVPITLFYPAEDGLTKVEKTLSGGSVPVKLAESVLQEYFKGFSSDLKNTVVRGVYEDRNKVLYVDLSDDLRRHFSGEARYEYYLLKSIYQTLTTNIVEVRDVKILVEGREIDSLGGHVQILMPLRETVWY